MNENMNNENNVSPAQAEAVATAPAPKPQKVKKPFFQKTIVKIITGFLIFFIGIGIGSSGNNSDNGQPPDASNAELVALQNDFDALQVDYDSLYARYQALYIDEATNNNDDDELIALQEANAALQAEIAALQAELIVAQETAEEIPDNEPEDEPEEVPEVAETEDVPREFTNALRSGRDYLRFMAFSRSGLGNQLDFEGFPEDAIEWALSELDEEVDWYEQAAIKAENYLDLMGLSHSRLIDQLIFEGFTQEQATFGADSAFE